MILLIKGIRERFERSSVGRRLVSGTFWSLGGSVLSRVFALLTSVVVARLLGKEGFGELGIIQSTVGMFGVLAGAGIGIAGTKFVAEYRVKDPARTGQIMEQYMAIAMLTGLCVSISLAAFSYQIAAGVVAAARLSDVLKIAALMPLLAAWGTAQNSFLFGLEAFKKTSGIAFITAAISLPVTVVAVWALGIEGAVWSLIITQLSACVVGSYALRREKQKAGITTAYPGVSCEWTPLIYYSVPSFLYGVVLWSVNWACNVVLVNQSNGYDAMGIFNAANQWRTLVMFLPNVLIGIMLPVLSNLHSHGDWRRVRTVVLSMLAVNAGLVLILVALSVVFAGPILSLYGKDFASATTVLQVLTVSCLPAALAYVLSQVLMSFGRMWTCFFLLALWGAVSMVTAWFIVPLASALGLAWVNVVSQSIYVLVLSVAVWKLMQRQKLRHVESGMPAV